MPFALPRSIFVSALFLFFATTAPIFAQQPGAAALERSRSLSSELEKLFQLGDLDAARRKAADASAAFAAQGEAWLAASYAVAAAEYDIRLGNAARIDAELYPRRQELLATLDAVEASRGDTLVELLMDATGMLKDATRQEELATLYESRIRKAKGENSEADLAARIRASYSFMQYGGAEAGYKRLHEALRAAAATDHHAFTMKAYAEAGSLLHANRLNDQAAEIFAEGEQSKAAQADVKEAADFFLGYADFVTAVKIQQPHFVPLYTTATQLYARFYGNESRELIEANDKLAMALAGIGQFGTAINLEQGNYDLAVKVLGEEDTLTWRLAGNLAGSLRGLGAPSRALDYDKSVLAKLTKAHGPHNPNVVPSAINVALDYLDLGKYEEARRLFQQCRDVLVATKDTKNLPQIEAWIEYTDLTSGVRQLDDGSIGKMDALITNADVPAILSYKAAELLADHFAKAGEPTRRMKHLDQAYRIAGGEMGPTHPRTFAGRIAMAKAKTDTAAAASDFASIDRDMLGWVYLQVFYAGRRDVVETTRAMADDMLYDYAQLAERDASVVAAFADAARRWPSLATPDEDNVVKLSRLIDPSDAETSGILQQITRLSRNSREIFAAGSEMDIGYKLIEKLKALEADLTTRMEEKYKIGKDDLSKPLPAAGDLLASDQALVQYFITRKWRADRESADPFEDMRLYAIVSRKGQAPKLHNLGDPREITSEKSTLQLASLRSTRSARGATVFPAMQEKVSDLYDRLIAPLESDLAGAQTVFIIPDGQLFAVPFSLLSDPQGRLLEERFTLRLLSRPEALYGVTAEQVLPKGGRALLAGSIDYAKGPEKGAEPLPGTGREIEAISGILTADAFKVDELTGDAVSETALRKEMEGATIAHLATHAAYGSAKDGGARGVDTLWQSEIILSHSGDRRTMRRDDGDGRLYAFELMDWDLSKLDLLVLSACETGRGDETFVGGLRGLPTAVSVAGAKRALLTLWPVADEGTAEFMTRFYKHLTAHMTYAEALRQTRRDAIAGELPAAKDPLVWAAFAMFEN